MKPEPGHEGLGDETGVLARHGPLLLTLLIGVSLALGLWYASRGLHPDRYWDERFSLNNVRVVLATGWIAPASGYYQTLSYLPQAAVLAVTEWLHRWLGLEALAIFDAERQFTATAFLLCRSLPVFYGAGCLLLTFVLGRRLFNSRVGLLGAFLLAVTPWFVQGSTMFKPDILLALAILVSFWWSLGVAEEPSLKRYVLAGCGIALAVSSKLTGALAVIPLAVAAVGSDHELERRVRGMAAGGGAGTTLFVLLNPHFPIYVEFLGRNLDHYARRAESYAGTHLGVVGREAEWLVSGAVHGRAVGALALVAVVALAVRLFRWRRRDREVLVPGWMFLSYPLGYSAVYAMATPHFKANNFLPILPFTSLLAAWAIAELWGLAKNRWPWLRRGWILGPAGTLLVLTLAPTPFLYVYRHSTPTTADRALRFLQKHFRRQDPTVPRLVFAEAGTEQARRQLGEAIPGKDTVAIALVDRLAGLASSRLERADGEIFPASRLEGEPGDPYWRRIVAVPRSWSRRIEAEPFAAYGASRVAVAHPWRSAGPRLPGTVQRIPGQGSGWRLSLPRDAEGVAAFSLLISVSDGDEAPRIEAGGREVSSWPVAGTRRSLFLSERVAPTDRPIRLVASEPSETWDSDRVRILLWLEPEPGT